MALRCNPGDLALIIRDEPGCEVNIGRLVRVEGSLRQCGLGAYHWLIKPVSPAPYAVFYPCHIALQDPQHFTDVEHPDLWLLPLREEPGVGHVEEEVAEPLHCAALQMSSE